MMEKESDPRRELDESRAEIFSRQQALGCTSDFGLGEGISGDHAGSLIRPSCCSLRGELPTANALCPSRWKGHTGSVCCAGNQFTPLGWRSWRMLRSASAVPDSTGAGATAGDHNHLGTAARFRGFTLGGM